MTRTSHISMYAALQTKELVVTNAEFLDLKKRLAQHVKEDEVKNQDEHNICR